MRDPRFEPVIRPRTECVKMMVTDDTGDELNCTFVYDYVDSNNSNERAIVALNYKVFGEYIAPEEIIEEQILDYIKGRTSRHVIYEKD